MDPSLVLATSGTIPSRRGFSLRAGPIYRPENGRCSAMTYSASLFSWMDWWSRAVVSGNRVLLGAGGGGQFEAGSEWEMTVIDANSSAEVSVCIRQSLTVSTCPLHPDRKHHTNRTRSSACPVSLRFAARSRLSSGGNPGRGRGYLWCRAGISRHLFCDSPDQIQFSRQVGCETGPELGSFR